MSDNPDPPPPATRVARRFGMMLAFLRSESAGGAVLIVSAAAALIWSNSAAAPLYDRLFSLPIGVNVGTASVTEEFSLWINDGLMAVFFLLVGLELRRELTRGELASVRRAALPGIAALGGMMAPALIYTALNWSDPAALRGWAVPVATDIAFALAVISVLGRHVPVALKVFLTALAIMDDLGAIVVIALFYTRGLDLVALGGAGALWLGLFVLGRRGTRSLTPFLIGGVLLWMLLFRSGVHATLAGVALAFAVPMDGEASPALRLERSLTPMVFFVVLPLFGLANAGLPFSALSPYMLRDTVALGVLAGLVIGKQVGVFAAVWLAVKLRVAQMPAGITGIQMYGAAILCGIGFTMSLFIGDLAFRGQVRGEEVKLAVFLGSLISAGLGLGVLALAARRAGLVRAAVAGQPLS